MNKLISIIPALMLLSNTSIADHPLVRFTVYHTGDVKRFVDTQGIADLSISNMHITAVANGEMTPESQVLITAGERSIRVALFTSECQNVDAPDAYQYRLSWFDLKQKKSMFALTGWVKLAKDNKAALPFDWDKHEYTVVFETVNLGK